MTPGEWGVELHAQIKHWFSGNQRPETPDDLEGTMKRVSLVLALVGFALMVAGLILMLSGGASFSSLGMSALSILPLAAWTHASLGLVLTSSGIILLALLPLVRVLLALRLYLKSQNLLDTGATLIVVLELLLSTWIG
jgi:uncharacterized membrane protein